ncbi:MAG: tRNA/helicase-type nucleic acid binding protein [Rhodocyclaceae bacterium]|nr:MAG: tRNA/helicase-type nucleic acid binding protein [Rhodocyclaceae bacterium]TND03724.1 MAG: tRNA/helicase-type nucleic acid binding protein [Rhodocyclaceae bacterium]
MKLFVAVFMLLCASAGWSADQPAASQATVLKGEVLEVKDVDTYTYVRLKTADGETWAAVGRAPLKKGAKVVIEDVTVMNNFESKALKRTFPKIVFGTLAGTGAASGMPAGHSGMPKVEHAGDVKVPKASGADARTVAEVIGKSAELKDKTVLIRGKVVKYSPGIMGKNWIHLRDGSGSAADNTNDLLVTTTDQTKVGDVVVVKGLVHTDRDFGSGYAYKVLVEEARLQQ